MTDIELVIKIPEKVYTYMQSRFMYQNKGSKGLSLFEEAGVAIKNGTPLPKGHGDLIDKSEAIISLFDYYSGKKTIGQCIDEVQTIIEKDKAESEEV